MNLFKELWDDLRFLWYGPKKYTALAVLKEEKRKRPKPKIRWFDKDFNLIHTSDEAPQHIVMDVYGQRFSYKVEYVHHDQYIHHILTWQNPFVEGA